MTDETTEKTLDAQIKESYNELNTAITNLRPTVSHTISANLSGPLKTDLMAKARALTAAYDTFITLTQKAIQ